jgi:hypothetical protein
VISEAGPNRCNPSGFLPGFSPDYGNNFLLLLLKFTGELHIDMWFSWSGLTCATHPAFSRGSLLITATFSYHYCSVLRENSTLICDFRGWAWPVQPIRLSPGVLSWFRQHFPMIIALLELSPDFTTTFTFHWCSVKQENSTQRWASVFVFWDPLGVVSMGSGQTPWLVRLAVVWHFVHLMSYPRRSCISYRPQVAWLRPDS